MSETMTYGQQAADQLVTVEPTELVFRLLADGEEVSTSVSEVTIQKKAHALRRVVAKAIDAGRKAATHA